MRAIVTGRVTVRSDDQLVIQAELMNVETGAQIWGDQYSRPQSDLLAVQDEIATEILDKIRPRLSGEAKEKATQTAHRGLGGVSALPAGPLPLEQGHDGRLPERDRVLPAGDRSAIRNTRSPMRAWRTPT